jgi:hypothetical protein
MAQSIGFGSTTSKEAYNFAIDYVRFRLREECKTDPSFERQMDYLYAEYCTPPLETERKYRVLRSLARTVEKRYTSTFDDMCKKLRIEKLTAASTYHAVLNELFHDGVNWGRICAVYAFAGALSVHLVKKGYRDLLALIPHWVSSYIDNNLKDWIADHKGWVGVIL